jgi:rhamnosyltransferase
LHILTIILTYRPALSALHELCVAILPQTSATLIVNNGSSWDYSALLSDLDTGLKNRIQILSLPNNLGVAAGHNRGITWARERGYTHVLLMDQDSVPATDMVAKLANALAHLKREGQLVAGVGPRYTDRYTGNASPFVRFGKLTLERIACSDCNNEIVETDFLITSGSLIPLHVIDLVGPLDEGLFIDHVDTEWVLRAKNLGYGVFGACGATMQHSLGESTLRFWVGRWRHIPAHRPERHYYVFRNSLVLFARPYAPSRWIFNDIVRLLYMIVFYPLFAPPRLQRLRFMLKGIWHGLRRVQGPLR